MFQWIRGVYKLHPALLLIAAVSFPQEVAVLKSKQTEIHNEQQNRLRILRENVATRIHKETEYEHKSKFARKKPRRKELGELRQL